MIASEFQTSIPDPPPPQVPQPYEEPLSVRGTPQERSSVSSNSAFGSTVLLTTPSPKVKPISEPAPDYDAYECQGYEEISTHDDTKAARTHGYNKSQDEHYAKLTDTAVYSQVDEETATPPPNIQALYAIVDKGTKVSK